MAYFDHIDARAIDRLREIYERYNVPRIINARNLDFQWRKDGREGHEQADAIKDLLRYLPRIIAKLEQDPDPRPAPETLGDVLSNALADAAVLPATAVGSEGDGLKSDVGTQVQLGEEK